VPPTDILASCLADDSAIARLSGDTGRAITAIEEVRRLEEAAGRDRSDDHADTLLLLSRAYGQAGRYRDAAQTATRSVELRAEIGHGDTPGMMNIRLLLATMLRDGGQPDKALSILEGERARHASRGGSPDSVAPLEYETALTLIRLGRSSEALPLLVRTGASARERGDATLVRATSIGRILALTDLGRTAEARSAFDATEPLYARLRADRQYTARLFLFAKAHVGLARGDLDAAAAALDEAATILTKLANPADPAWRFHHAYAARLAVQQKRYEAAQRSASAALQLSRQQAIDPEASIFVGEDLALRAEALRGMGNAASALQDAQAAIAHFTAVAATSHPMYQRALNAR
jgi:tetratricopeptide (TPR) repeat protein